MTVDATGHGHRRPPVDCPVCAERLQITGLGCSSCGTGINGAFATCPYCALTDADLALLRVFLASRGNMREVEKHLQVSYPTARARFARLCEKLGVDGESDAPADDRSAERERILADLAAGELTVDEAESLLRR